MEETKQFAHLYGNFAVGTDSTVYVNGTPVPLRPIERHALLALLQDAGAPISRQLIASRTMRIGYGEASSRSIDIGISRLRNALGTERWRIQSVHGMGYRFDPRQSMELNNE